MHLPISSLWFLLILVVSLIYKGPIFWGEFGGVLRFV